MAERPTLLIVAVIVLVITNGAVAYLHWGPSQAPSPTEPATTEENDEDRALQADPAPVWSAPTWRIGERWTYTLERDGSQAEVFLEVRDDGSTFDGTPTYAVFRSADNTTTHFHRETLNQLTANGTEQEIFSWPLRDGANWTLTGPDGRRAQVTAEFVHDIVTPLGLLDGYKITADYETRPVTEVYYYVDSYRSYVRVEDYNQGHRTLTLVLTGYDPGA